MLGVHVFKSIPHSNIREMFETIFKINENIGISINSFQIFICGPKNTRFIFSEEELEEIGNIIRERNLKAFVHNSYLAHPWKHNKFSLSLIKKQCEIADKYRFKGLVVHLPVTPLSQNMEILEKLPKNVFLENPSCTEKNAFYVRDDSLNILSSMGLGVCVDTAHLWANNVDISSRDAAKTFIDTKLLNINKDKLLFHLNDSLNPLGAGVDFHCNLFGGEIWKNYIDCPEKSGVSEIVNFATENNLPLILERHNLTEYIADLNKIYTVFSQFRINDVKFN